MNTFWNERRRQQRLGLNGDGDRMSPGDKPVDKGRLRRSEQLVRASAGTSTPDMRQDVSESKSSQPGFAQGAVFEASDLNAC